MKKITLIFSMLMLALSNFSFAQDPGIVISNKPGWHKIGDVKANFTLEKETIAVLGADKFKSIKLKVVDAPINIDQLQVFYESGESEEINVRNELKAGAETRIIDLKYPAKELKKVVFVYKTVPNSADEKAQVELYGLK